ncbi:glutathione S-transferase [Ramlibacter montanisoli]|uniref:Glutathione S-transferase n=1 Tax=Ramlibacter montanisoli TaxID=2732512 RepID=A0A849KIG9_9BURK|nr:glutathione S-transferase [Ramlibacter montanisoli]NNU45226.1 glutathione S-transferase [Ramlibacter montanisoli]
MAYELHYWPGIQGRGEFVRLALEAAGAPYVDVARGDEDEGAGLPAMLHYLEDASVARPPFACPFLVDGRKVIGQTAAILLYLGPRLKLAPAGEADRLWLHQVQLTLADLVAEVHELHHPIASSLYYEDQKKEALRRSEDFRRTRLPKFLGWCEAVLQRNAGNAQREVPRLVGARLTYADLSLFQVVDGLLYALPKATRRTLRKTPLVAALHEGVPRQRRLAAYLASERRIPFNTQGIFRHYPELDA